MARRGDGPTTCRWCGARVLWSRHVRTGKAAPIDWDPVPGGNVVVHGDTYEVLVGSEREAMDPTVIDENAHPTLRLNHWVTCTSTKADQVRRNSAQRRVTEVAVATADVVDVRAAAAGEYTHHPDPED